MWNETQKEKADDIIGNAGSPGIVTVATNNGGRGTDISLSNESLANGGLHVLVTFRTKSVRVQEQAIGRAGRQSQPGSSQTIIKNEEVFKSFESSLLMLLTQNPLQALDMQREIFAKKTSQDHQYRANIERFCFHLIENFLISFTNWKIKVSSEDFLNQHSLRLASLKLFRPLPSDLTTLSLEERSIAEDCLNLLSRKGPQESNEVEILR